MPVHDWTRVVSGIFHHFHQRWIGAICDALNGGVLPTEFYALAEQVAEGPHPDVLALETRFDQPESGAPGGAAVALVERPPKVRFTEEAEREIYAQMADRVAVYHASGDRVVAFAEIVSPGNKHSRFELTKFLKKIEEALERGCHLLVVDVHPPGRNDPRGIHASFWEERVGDSHGVTADQPLGLSAYRSDVVPTAYFERVGIGQPLPDMPLFLTPDYYIDVPLEDTYEAVWSKMPQRWKRVIEGTDKPAQPPTTDNGPQTTDNP